MVNFIGMASEFKKTYLVVFANIINIQIIIKKFQIFILLWPGKVIQSEKLLLQPLLIWSLKTSSFWKCIFCIISRIGETDLKRETLKCGIYECIH